MTSRRRSSARPAASRFGRYALAAATSASGVAALAAPSTARADFSGPYTVNPPANGSYTTAGIYGDWTATFSGAVGNETINTTSAPVSLSLSDNGVNFNTNQFDFITSIAGAGPLSFNYSLTLGTGSAQYVFNGTPTPLSNGSGTITIPSVAAGNTFGFRLGNTYSSAVSLTISNFAAPVPEPTVNALIAAGAIGLLGLRESRRRRAARLAVA